MSAQFKPMLSGKVDFAKLQYPVLASPKFDGIRCLVRNGKPVSRSLKAIPNSFIQSVLSDWALDGLDGELIVGEPYAKNVYQITDSGVMTRAGNPDFKFYVFDVLPDFEGETYEARLRRLEMTVRDLPSALQARIEIVPQTPCTTEAELLAFEATLLDLGYEGIMVRSASGLYKNGRSTTREGALLKLKRFEDSEAVVLGFECMYHNGNAATVDALGHTDRSSHRENMIPLNTLGKLVVRDTVSGVEFSIGTGFSAKQREDLWADQDNLIGKLVKYKHFPIGVVDKPRFPVFLGFRSKDDL